MIRLLVIWSDEWDQPSNDPGPRFAPRWVSKCSATWERHSNHILSEISNIDKFDQYSNNIESCHWCLGNGSVAVGDPSIPTSAGRNFYRGECFWKLPTHLFWRKSNEVGNYEIRGYSQSPLNYWCIFQPYALPVRMVIHRIPLKASTSQYCLSKLFNFVLTFWCRNNPGGPSQSNYKW